MWLADSMNLLLFRYQCSGGTTSVDIPVKIMVASFLLVGYCVYSTPLVFGAIGSTLRVVGV